MRRPLSTFDAALTALVVLLLAGLVLLATGGVSREGMAYEAALHELTEVDATLNRDLLRLAVGELEHYDTLVRAADDLRGIENRLNREPAGLGSATAFSSHRLNVSILLGQKLELLEEFKTAHAKALAARAYFPELVATSDGFRSAGSGVSRGELVALLGDTAGYLQNPTPPMETVITERLAALTPEVEAEPGGLEPDPEIIHLASRIRAIVEGKKQVQEVYREITAVPVAGAGAALAGAFADAYRSSQQRSLYWFSGFLSVLVLVLAALAVVPRWRHRKHLQAAEEQEAALKDALKEARTKSAYLKRDEAHEAARLAEERHAALVRHSFEVMAILSRQDHFIYVSPACESLFGLIDKELIGKSVYEGIHTDDLIKVEDYFMRAQKELEMEDTVQYRVMDAYGKWYLVETFASNQASNPAVRGMVLNTRILHAVESGKPAAAR